MPVHAPSRFAIAKFTSTSTPPSTSRMLARRSIPTISSSTLQAAHVNSITVFAKCHHGWSYYPTTIGAPHPHLARPDLMGDMVRALKAADIEAPIYISVMWDERNARIHPEWRVMSATNSYHHATPERSRRRRVS